MINTIYLIIAITLALCTLCGMTIASFLSLNKSFREHLEDLLDGHDKENKNWTRQLLIDHFYPLDERIKNLNYRLKTIEKKCDRTHETEK